MTLLLALLACVKTTPPVDSTPSVDTADTAPPAPKVLVVSGYNSDALHLFDPATGAPIGELGPVPGAQSVRPGPSGGWLVVAEKDGAVLRLDPETGELSTLIAGGTGLSNPTSAITSPGGEIWAGDYGLDQVLRFDATGAPLGVFTDGDGQSDGPDAGLLIGPDGLLYLPGFESDNVLRIDPDSGAVVDTFASAADGDGLANPRVIQIFGEDLLISSWGGSGVMRYSPSSGYQDLLINTRRATGFVLDEDNGWWLVCNDQNDRVLRYDAESLELIDTFIERGEGGIEGATFLALIEAPWLQ